MKANPNYVLAAGVILVVIVLAAYIVCGVLAIDPGPILSLVGPVIAALFLVPKLDRVERNTNGALTGGIKSAMHETLDERGVAPTTQAGLAQTFPSADAASDSSGN